MRKLFLSSATLAVLLATFLFINPAQAAGNAKSKLIKANSIFKQNFADIDVTVEIELTEDGGWVTINGTRHKLENGKTIEVVLDENGAAKTADPKSMIDLNPEKYQVIDFGKDKNTLVLVPKNSKNEKFEVALDPKTGMPVRWSTLTKGKTGWEKTGALKISLK